MDFQKALNQIPNPLNSQKGNGITSSIVDEMDSAHCCLICKREIRRLELHVLDRIIRPLPVCNCIKEKELAEHRERELAAEREKVKRIYGEGLIDEELKNASFDNFNHRPELEGAYRIAKDFATNFQDQEFGLYMFGPVGVGKSHLAASIHNELIQQGYASVFIDVTQLFGLAKSTFKDEKKSDQDYIQAAIKCDLLTLDEIGLTGLSSYEFGILFQILNGRKGKLTNITSNLNLDRLQKWFAVDNKGKPLDVDGRVFDRLIGSTLLIESQASSYRVYKAQQRMMAMQRGAV
jgi:DNA replication protein DnaC